MPCWWAGSWVLMGERIDNWQEWAGSAVVAFAITFYLFCHYKSNPTPEEPSAVGGSSTEPLLPGPDAAATSEAPISRAVPVARRNAHALDQAALAATPGSLPSLSFRGYLRPSGFNVPNVQVA